MDDPGFIIWILILAFIAVATLVRKIIEKAGAPEGKKVDVGQAVEREIRRYFGVPERKSTPPPVPAERAAPPRPAATRPAARPATPPPVVKRPAPKKPARAPVPPKKKLLVTRAVGGRAPKAPRFTAKDVRRAVVMAELLGPPVAERRDYRLF